VRADGLVLIGFFLMARAIVNSKYGRVLQAIRDAETASCSPATTRWPTS
jgi:ABC-type branched-subunit amino acid transport system permease subunit